MPLGEGISWHTYTQVHAHTHTSECICRVKESYYTPARVGGQSLSIPLAYGIMIDYRITL